MPSSLRRRRSRAVCSRCSLVSSGCPNRVSRASSTGGNPMAHDTHYDVIIIGTGAGGGTLAYRLAPSGKRILLLERGGYLRRERDNWDSTAVFVRGKYRAQETWRTGDGKEFHPGIHYYVGGNTKVYGAARLRLSLQ